MSLIKEYPERSLLSAVEPFYGLCPDGLDSARASARICRIGKEEVIFEQGEKVLRAHALIRGSARIIQTGSDGQQSLLRFIEPGEMFGIIPLFTDHKFPADAIAAEPSLILSWSEENFFTLIEKYPRISRNIIRVVGERLYESQNRIRELATQHAEQRLVHVLIRLSQKVVDNKSATIEINLPIRRKDFAEMAGISFYTASRILAAWEKEGLLKAGRQHIIIKDISALVGKL